MAEKIDLKKLKELQKLIDNWTKEKVAFKEICELQKKPLEGALKIVKAKYSSVLKDGYSPIESWYDNGEDSLKKLEKNIKEITEELKCPHDNILEDDYSGSDSHHDYYDTRCKDCGAVFYTYKS